MQHIDKETLISGSFAVDNRKWSYMLPTFKLHSLVNGDSLSCQCPTSIYPENGKPLVGCF